VIGWKAKKRIVDLTIERPFNGEELLLRMKGWITVEPKKVVEVVRQHGFLKVLDEEDLVVEVEGDAEYQALEADLEVALGDQFDLERI
jgi:hypothetical protein